MKRTCPSSLATTLFCGDALGDINENGAAKPKLVPAPNALKNLRLFVFIWIHFKLA
jgi:hypothetical protein